METTFIGIDLGGTKIFGALVDREGRLSEETYVPHGPGAAADGEASFARLAEVVGGLRARAGGTAAGVGVGAPGITRADGVIASAPALGWKDFPLARRLTDTLGLPAAVENDVNLAALGELRFGAARGARDFVCLSVGTGIGGAVVVDGRLVRGRRDAAGEVGATLPGREFLPWRDPDWGALETVASGTGIARRAARGGHPATAEEVFAAAAAGEPWATSLFEETMDYLAVAIGNVQALLDPELIVLGGGVGRAADRIIPAVARRLEGGAPGAPRLVASALGYRAAVLGAPALLGG